MIYLKGIVGGLVGSFVSLIVLVAIIMVINVVKPPRGLYVIRIFGPMPFALATVGFVAGFYLAFRLW